MADFPGGVYSPRTKENKPGIVYTPAKKTIGYAEDVTKLDAEVVALETFLSPKLLTIRPRILINLTQTPAKPTQVQRGAFFGYSLPIYNADNEELFFQQRVPHRWDGASDIRIKIRAVLSAGEDVGDKFKFQLSWEHAQEEEVVPATVNDLEVETTILAGRNTAYDKYKLSYTIDYDIDGAGHEIKPGELLAVRVRRIAASELEVSNEIIFLDCVIQYRRDKFGGAF